jgi:DNA-binding NarL/FixJ family response regulator
MIRVFLVDDHELFLSGVRAELGERFKIAGWAADVDVAIEQIPDAAPDVVLVDVHMAGGGGLAVVKNLSETHPDMKFLALSVSDAAEDVIAMIRAGARGYVTKSISPEDLAASVTRVYEGDAVFSPRLAGFVLDAFSEVLPAESDPELDQLTTREKEVLRQIARGYSYKQIARRLSISIKTVEAHVSSVLRKLQLSSRYELARWATDRRIV